MPLVKGQEVNLPTQCARVAACQVCPKAGDVYWTAIHSGAAASVHGHTIEVAGSVRIQTISGWIGYLNHVMRAATPLSLRNGYDYWL